MATTASDFSFYTTLFTKLDAVLTTYIGNTVVNIITSITPATKTLLAIYIMLWGWSMMRGVIQEPITDGIFRVLKLTTIVTIAINVGYYNIFLSDFLWKTPDALASVLGNGSLSSGSSAGSYLDGVMHKMYDFGNAFIVAAFKQSNWGIPNLALLIEGWIIWLVGAVATLYGAFLMALAKISLAILLAIGPIFVLLLMFDGTKRFFDSWIGQAINAVLTVVLTAGTLYLIMDILSAYLVNNQATADVNPGMLNALPAIVFGGIGTLVLLQIPSLASALGGGVATGTLGAVGWAYGKAKSGASSMRPTNLRRSARKLGHDVNLARSAVNSPGRAASNLANKIRTSRGNRVTRG